MKTNFEIDIYQQPAVIRQLINENGEEFSLLAEKFRDLCPSFVLIAARGLLIMQQYTASTCSAV